MARLLDLEEAEVRTQVFLTATEASKLIEDRYDHPYDVSALEKISTEKHPVVLTLDITEGDIEGYEFNPDNIEAMVDGKPNPYSLQDLLVSLLMSRLIPEGKYFIKIGG